MGAPGHSTLGPSAAHRWINCPGSVGLSAKAPAPPPSPHAAEGNVAHKVAEEMVLGRPNLAAKTYSLGTVHRQSGFEFKVDEDMIDGARQYAEAIRADIRWLEEQDKRPAPIQLKVEQRVKVPAVDAALWGTLDAAVYRPGHKLIVYDYKYGKGVVVESRENPQLAIYALGAMSTFAGRAFDEIELVVVQPRAPHIDGPVRRWSAPRKWFDDFEETLRAAVKATRSAAPRLVAGDWCRWCPARAECPALTKAVQAQAMADFSKVPVLPPAETLPTDKLAQALRWEDTILSWFKAVHQTVKARLEADPDAVPGYKLVEGRSHRKWADEEKVKEEFEPVLGDEIYQERKLKSPAQLEKIVGKGKIKEGLTHKPEGARSVAPETDPRPEAKSQAELDFKPEEPNDYKALF